MNNILRYAMALFAGAFFFHVSMAQVDTTGHRADTTDHRPDTANLHRQLAIFAPLYLDSAFDAGGNYRYDKNFPKFINPGLEFYEGARLALDSLNAEHARLEVHIYDTRSSTQPMSQVLQSPEFQQTGLILGHVTFGEMQQLAAAAARMNIPFINVNYPNDAGITNNPDLVILNSTLRTHCEGIYRFIQRNYATKPIVCFRKKGTQEDRLKNYFTEIDKTTASVPLKIRYVNLDDNFNAAALEPYLDSTVLTICMAGSLDEGFGKTLCQALASLDKTYRTIVIGMPTWDNIDLSQPEFAGQEIVYTTPFYINPTDNLVTRIQQYFRSKFYSRPSDMVFRGYETTWRFGKLLLDYGKNVSSSIGEKKYKVFDDFDIQPVFRSKQPMTLDYLENKKLYFIRKVDGNITTVN